MAGVDAIIGAWIKEAEKAGEFKRNPHLGKRFEFTDGYLDTPEELRMAYKMLKNSGFVPPQVELLKELADLREELRDTRDESAQKRLRIEIANKEQQIAVVLDKYKKT